MVYTDKHLVCRECGQTFIFTSGEQEFFASLGFRNLPSHCPSCRAAKRRGHARSSPSSERRMYRAVCADCGAQTEVPFQPHEDRPVYCQSCYRARREAERGESVDTRA